LSAPTPLLAVENLTVELGTAGGKLRPVRGVDLSVARGETLGIVGESGCGKSLTALALMGLLPQSARRTADRLEFDAIDLRGNAVVALRGLRISMIFQEPMTALNPAFTVGRQLSDVLRRHRRVSRAVARDRALELLERVGVSVPHTRLRQYPHELSGGLRQRVLIAMALMCGPDLIIADEPTTALDVTIQAELLHLLADLRRQFGMAMILITHDLGVVSRIADRVAVMYAGEFVETGSAARIFEDPQHPYTRGLLACIPGTSATARRRLPSIPGTVPTLLANLEGCAFRWRCPHAREACASPIPLAQTGPDHAARCIGVPEAARLATADV
jgi:peptide/nickel transport system ATP-binding protein